MVTLIFTSEYANLLIFLYGLFLLLFFYARKTKKQRALKFGNYSTLKRIAGKHFIESSQLLFILHLLAITALTIGVSSPALVEYTPQSASDYTIAIDASSSMFAEDITPTRFEAAKDSSSSFIGRLGNNSEVGVVSFGGQAVQETNGPVPTQQAQAIVENLDMSQTAGTAIGDAVITATNMLRRTNRSRRVMLITDGRNNAGVSINESISFARRHNTSIYAIGIGSTENSTQTTRTITIDGENITETAFPNIDTAQLTRLARETGGNVSFITNRTAFESALIEMTHQRQQTNLASIFVLIGVVLLLLDWVFKTTQYTSLP